MATIDMNVRVLRSRNNEELRALIESAFINAHPMTYLDALKLINTDQTRPYSYESFRAYFVNLQSPRWRPVSDQMLARAREVISPYIAAYTQEGTTKSTLDHSEPGVGAAQSTTRTMSPDVSSKHQGALL